MTHEITRRFVDVGGRQAHLRIMGSGPPALFVHSSPANSSFVVKEMEVQAGRYTCFAFDSPGFGLSDALPGDPLSVGEIADALAANLDAIGMPPCPVFGTHTGASIALELGSRHPQRVTGLMLDGLAVFTQAEFDDLTTGYFPPLVIDPLGGHLTSTWTRFRDQSTWFPWFSRDHNRLNESDLTSPEATNIWVTMFWDAARTYAPAYRAALAYKDGPKQVAALKVPAVLSAIESDMLYPHLDRLPPENGNHSIRRVGFSLADRRALTSEAFDRFGSPGVAPEIGFGPRATAKIVRQFVDTAGGQLLLRSVGDPANPALFIVHDSPGAGQRVEGRMQALASDRFVIAFDLPGCGESAPIEDASIAGFAAALAEGLAAIGIAPAVILGIGFGSSVAIDLAAGLGTPVLALDGLLLPDGAERTALIGGYAPPITVQADGSHWYRTWLMLRDSLVWFPWFTTTRAALRRVDADYGADMLHDWTRETLRQPATYAGPIDAALAHDGAKALVAFKGKLVTVTDGDGPLATAYAPQIAALPGATATAGAALGDML